MPVKVRVMAIRLKGKPTWNGELEFDVVPRIGEQVYLRALPDMNEAFDVRQIIHVHDRDTGVVSVSIGLFERERARQGPPGPTDLPD